jgi:hypothetical protein
VPAPNNARARNVTRIVGGREYSRHVEHGLVSAAEAAQLLRVTTRTVWNLVARGKLHRRRQGPRTVFHLTDVLACAKSRGD